MKCFYHHDRDAFGVCQSCGKALCLDCMQFIKDKVSCKNEICAYNAKILDAAYANIRNTYSKTNKHLIIATGWIITFIGLVPVLTGNFNGKLFGLIFMGIGIWVLTYGANITAIDKPMQKK